MLAAHYNTSGLRTRERGKQITGNGLLTIPSLIGVLTRHETATRKAHKSSKHARPEYQIKTRMNTVKCTENIQSRRV
jgi:hypothetical protein